MTHAEFHALYTKHAAHIHALVWDRFDDSTPQADLSPDEVLSATFERLQQQKAYVNRNVADPDAGSDHTPVWLVVAVQSTATTMLRSEQRRRRRQRQYVRLHVASGVVGLSRQDPHDRRATTIELERALRRLREIDFLATEAAMLVYQDGLTWAEAAKGLGTGKPDRLRARVSRAFRTIRAEQALDLPRRGPDGAPRARSRSPRPC